MLVALGGAFFSGVLRNRAHSLDMELGGRLLRRCPAFEFSFRFQHLGPMSQLVQTRPAREQTQFLPMLSQHEALEQCQQGASPADLALLVGRGGVREPVSDWDWLIRGQAGVRFHGIGVGASLTLSGAVF